MIPPFPSVEIQQGESLSYLTADSSTEGLICPYCNSAARLVDDATIYHGRSYGKKVWVCEQFPACDSYVGCHKGSDRPLGRMANKALRDAKQAAHGAFDALWLRKVEREGCSKKHARTAGYAWLARQLGIRADECHIGMMDAETCLRVVEICKR